MTPSPWHRPPDSGGDRAPRPRRRYRRLIWWFAGLAVLFLLLGWAFPPASLGEGALYSLLLLVTIGSALVVSLDLRFREFVRYGAIWAAIVGVIAALYAFRHEIGYVGDRIAGAAVPERGYAMGEAMVFERGRDGHFHVRAEVDGVPVSFLVDTGATNIVLARSDARRLGINPPRERFFERYYTANGVVMAAPVYLEAVEIGGIRIEQVRASVTEGDLGVSLLGMSFLDQLGSVEISGDRLVLRP